MTKFYLALMISFTSPSCSYITWRNQYVLGGKLKGGASSRHVMQVLRAYQRSPGSSRSLGASFFKLALWLCYYGSVLRSPDRFDLHERNI